MGTAEACRSMANRSRELVLIGHGLSNVRHPRRRASPQPSDIRNETSLSDRIDVNSRLVGNTEVNHCPPVVHAKRLTHYPNLPVNEPKHSTRPDRPSHRSDHKRVTFHHRPSSTNQPPKNAPPCRKLTKNPAPTVMFRFTDGFTNRQFRAQFQPKLLEM